MSLKKQTLTVSVVIPAYNEEAVIMTCLHALLEQTVKPDEIIVVDNNSTDSTAALVSTVNGVRLIREPKQGIAHARNAGFNAASSDIIARIDADTIVPADWIEQIRGQLSADGALVGISGPASFYDHPFGRAADHTFNSWNYWGNRLIAGSPILWGSNMAFRRSAWLQVRDAVNNDDSYWEDVDLSMRVRSFGTIGYIRELQTATSARSCLASSTQLARYFARWPRTYAQFGFRTTIISRLLYLSLTLLWLPGVLAKPIARQKELARVRQQRLQQRLKAWIGNI